MAIQKEYQKLVSKNHDYCLILTFPKQAFNESRFCNHSLPHERHKFNWQLPNSLAHAIHFEHRFIRQKWHWCCDWQRAIPESPMQNKPLVCSIGCPYSHWLFRFTLQETWIFMIPLRIFQKLNLFLKCRSKVLQNAPREHHLLYTMPSLYSMHCYNTDFDLVQS